MTTSNVLHYVSMGGSVLSIIVGFSYLIYGFTKLNFAYDNCDFFYCNTQWRGLVSLAPDVLMDTFQPMVLGFIGVLYALPEGSRPTYPVCMSPPSSSVLGGCFHILMALFGNIGYMFWFGIAVSAYNILAGIAIVIVNMMQSNGRVAARPKDLDELPTTAVASVNGTMDTKAHTAVIV